MHQKVAEDNIDFIFVYEYNKAEGPHWFPDSNNKAAIINIKRVGVKNLGASESSCRWIEAGRRRLQKLKGNANTDHIKSVAASCSGLEAFSLRNNEAVEFRGLDSDTTKEELIEHLKTSHPGTRVEDIKAMKTGRGGSVTGVVVLPSKVANKLATGPKIKIGWSQCRVHVRISMIRCSRCLEFGHRKYGCKGLDRTNTCKRCWGLDHSSKDCGATPKCGLCAMDSDDDSGKHYSGSSNCLAFKRFLNDNVQNDKFPSNKP